MAKKEAAKAKKTVASAKAADKKPVPAKKGKDKGAIVAPVQPKTLSSKGAEAEAAEKKPKAAKAPKAAAPKVASDDPELLKLQQKWASLYEKSKNQKAVEYNMTKVFEAKIGIQHKVLGWGYILSNQYDRLEVLFQDGVRFLISNYKK